MVSFLHETFSHNCWPVITGSSCCYSSSVATASLQRKVSLNGVISNFKLLMCSLSSLVDHRSLPVPHSTGATVSSSPQHHGSMSSPTNDISSMSTEPTLTDTDSSLEANAANASLGYCRWLSFPCLFGPVLSPPPPSLIKDRTWHWPFPLQHFPLSTSRLCVSSVV